MPVFGRSLELYFVEGRPDGMLTAEVFNWTGHVLKTPRTQIKPALSRNEATHTGVYLLLGERDGEPLAYVGESENVADRIRDHDSKKDWWSEVAIITTSANGLHKAHVKYLESRLVEEARKVGATPLENATTPPRASLSEAGQANMEEFLDTLFIVLPALGIDLFLDRRREDAPTLGGARDAESVHFVLDTPKHRLRAEARLAGSDFIVLKGSQARSSWKGTWKGKQSFGYADLHAKLVHSGILAVGPDCATFTENYAFSSPSAAAAVVNGRSANGRIEWKVKDDGRTYKDWETEQLSKDRGCP